MVTNYLNKTGLTVKLKTKNGEVKNAEANKWAETSKQDPFVKINYFNNWQKI